MVVVGSTNGSLDRGQTTTEDVAHLLRFGHWLPTSVGQYEFEHVPEHIARAAEEAHQAAEVGTHMAALLMARTTVEATAKDKGILKGSLFEKIDRLRDDAHIRSNIAEAAHQIRHLGNDMAHGDLDDAPDKEDVTDVLTLMDALLREVYETSAITSRIINRRQG
ncbi:DUF4145 domain-containing protein [Curtobacterium sp. NPDC092190]|uniref:DUF4145 domain-containing protein n=1 Tax=Curtobacterium sp. NPDC092190 TaxID=3363973 RepID=UPI003805C161